MQVSIAVAPAEPLDELRQRAADLADRLRLPLARSSPDDSEYRPPGGAVGNQSFRHVLVVARDRLELREPGVRNSRAICVDFVHGPTGHRRMTVGGRSQPLARAVGIRRAPPTVVDATAGLCRDAFLLAALGCRVTALERSPVLHALAEDGWDRAMKSRIAKVTAISQRIQLLQTDAREWLRRPAGDPPDVVYLDPMYPPSSKSAEVRREMRVLREVVGSDPDAAELFSVARDVARKRVVVKRLRHAASLEGDPSHYIVGTRVRYDVYVR